MEAKAARASAESPARARSAMAAFHEGTEEGSTTRANWAARLVGEIEEEVVEKVLERDRVGMRLAGRNLIPFDLVSSGRLTLPLKLSFP